MLRMKPEKTHFSGKLAQIRSILKRISFFPRNIPAPRAENPLLIRNRSEMPPLDMI